MRGCLLWLLGYSRGSLTPILVLCVGNHFEVSFDIISNGPLVLFCISQVVDFNGNYSSPEFTLDRMPVTTSGAAFFHSDRLRKQYKDDLFVGNFVNGMIFDFDLSEDKTQLSFDNKGPLIDKLADNAQELEEVIFGYGFGEITDIRIGTYDGYMYVLSLDRGGDECKPQYPDRSCILYSSTVEGHIFRIVPAAT